MIRRMIEEYKPFDEQEEKDRQVILDWMDKFDNLLTRENEFAHFTSSAIIVNRARDRVLFVHHNIYDSWGWVGGHADGEKDFLGVAIREAREETGVKNVRPVSEKIFLLDTLPVLGHEKRGKYVSAHTHLSVAYLLEADESEELHKKEDENSGVKWVPIGEMVGISDEPHMRRVYRKAIKKIARH